MNIIPKSLRMFFLLITFFSLPTLLPAHYTIIEDQMTESVKTPSLQNIQKVKIRLDNGLEALIISDPSTPKSGASVAVGVGNAHEPFENVGLAHFVEHMLFLGTEQYPVENEYHEFIDQNGGSANAYTSMNQTVYMYEINNDKMSEALSRFASSFSSPLFNASGLSRERQAVDNEFTYRTNLDGVREFLAFLEMTKKDHPLHTWRCGNKETLSKVSRDELIEWYKGNYGANKMNLAIYTALPMDQVLKDVDEAFSLVPQNTVTQPNVEIPILNPENLGKVVYLEPIKDVKSVSLWWEVPPEFAVDLDHHTMDLIGETLSEEYQGSLASFLKDQGLVQSFSAGGFSLEDHVAIFQISMELTERGVFEIDQIVGHTFEAIEYLKKEGIPRYRFDEKVNMAKLNYQYQSRPNVFKFISEASAQMKDEPLETYPQKHSWPSKFSKERNQALLDSLKPNRAIYIVTAPQSFLNKNLDQREKLSQAKFALEEWSTPTLQAWNNVKENPYIKMAPPNPYIPNNLELVQVDLNSEENAPPKVLDETERSFTYFSQDSVYKVPNVYYDININTPRLDSTAETQVLTDLYLLSIEDALSSLSDQGGQAGIQHSVSISPNFGIKVTLYGYSQKSQIYLKEVFEKLKTHRATEEQFLRYKERFLSHYENQVSKQLPLKQASQTITSILIKEYVPFDQKLEALRGINYSNLGDFQATLFDEVYTRTLLYGNLDEATAVEVNEFINDSFAGARPYPLENQKRRSVLELTEGSSPHYITKSSEMEGNAAFLLIGQGEMDQKKLAALSVFTKSIDTPFYDTLRTKQQTGYVVQSYSQEIERQLFSFFMVLSNSHAPRDLLARFELFNEEFLKTLNTEAFNQDKFDAIRLALISEMEQPKRSLAEKGGSLGTLAFEYQGDFELKEKRIEALRNLSFDEFLEFSYTYLGRNNPRRVASLVEGTIAPENALDYIPIQNITNFKTQLFYTSANVFAEAKDIETNAP